MKRLLIVILTLMSLASVLSISQASPSGATQTQTFITNGVLSLAERNALNAMPLNSVTATMVADVRESDLPYLTPDLRLAIVTPVNTTLASGEIANPVVTSNLYTAHRSVAFHTWRHKNRFGTTLYWFRINITWTWNTRRIWDFDSSVQADGSLGWHFCYARPDGEEWMGNAHTRRKRYSFGNFGHYLVSPGCVLGERVLGGHVSGDAWGHAYYRNGACCQEMATFTSAPPGREEWALAA